MTGDELRSAYAGMKNAKTFEEASEAALVVVQYFYQKIDELADALDARDSMREEIAKAKREALHNAAEEACQLQDGGVLTMPTAQVADWLTEMAGEVK